MNTHLSTPVLHNRISGKLEVAFDFGSGPGSQNPPIFYADFAEF